MKIERMTEIETTDIRIGDRVHIGNYTATCQEIMQKGALFLLDQYLDKAFPMNWNDTNEGWYEKSDLRKALQSDEVLNIFADIRDYMIPFDNGDLLRIPFAGEMFGGGLLNWVEPDGHEQWPLMRDRRNRIATRCGEYEWGWLQNKDITSSTRFCSVDPDGGVTYWLASGVFGVRPIFLISMKNEDTIKKSAPEDEETVRDVLDTFNETQRLVLYYIVGKEIEGEETILDVLNTFNDKQRLVLNYLVKKAVKDAKKGKTSKSKNNNTEEEQNMAQNIIGERIAGLLREQGKSQRKLAEQAGTTGASISRYIKGNRVPTGPVLANIAKALRTTTDYLLGNEQDSNDSDLEYNYIQRAIARNANRWSKKQKLDLVNALFENDD